MNTKKEKAVAFTGHRPEQLAGFEEITPNIHLFQEICRCIDEGYDTFYCGAARGADIICGEYVVDIRKYEDHPIKVICVIPFRNQPVGWSDKWKRRYWQLRKEADQNILLSETFSKGCYQARNRYMVDHADRIIAIYNGCEKGGTAYTVEYAKRQGKEIIIINPDTMERSVIPAREMKK